MMKARRSPEFVESDPANQSHKSLHIAPHILLGLLRDRWLRHSHILLEPHVSPLSANWSQHCFIRYSTREDSTKSDLNNATAHFKPSRST